MVRSRGWLRSKSARDQVKQQQGSMAARSKASRREGRDRQSKGGLALDRFQIGIIGDWS